MKNILLGAVLGIAGWQAFTQFQQQPVSDRMAAQAEPVEDETPGDEVDEAADGPEQAAFSCDGRTTCPQMTSCAEAEYFLEHCPGVTMDGNGDGEPCESQWCGDHR